MNLKKVNLKILSCFLAVIFLFIPKINSALGFFEKFTIYVDNIKYDFFYPEIEYTLNGYVLRGKDEIINSIYLDNLINAVDAELVFQPENYQPFTIINHKNGYKIDKVKLKNAIDYALLKGENSVKIKSEEFSPLVTRESLLEECFLRGQFSTYYGSSSNERKHNIKLASKIISGKKLLPGEIFSFNEIVGQRSSEKGFKEAKIIVDGAFVNGLGGGVCQLSTTLYNCALKSGLEIVESHPHSLSVSYVQPSFDAMVSYGSCDMKFLNNTKKPVYIGIFADGENLSVKFYGEKNNYSYKLVSKVTEVINSTTKIIKKEEANDKIKEIKGKNGMKSEGYIYVYKGDELVEVKKIRKDVYKKIDGVKIEGENEVKIE